MGLFSAGLAAFKVGFSIGDALFNAPKRKKAAQKKENAYIADTKAREDAYLAETKKQHALELKYYLEDKKTAAAEKAAYIKKEDKYLQEQREHNEWMREQSRYRSPRENILSQARGAREAADKTGFNPLTLLAYGQGGGSQLGGFANASTAPSMSFGLVGSRPAYNPPPPAQLPRPSAPIPALASIQAISGADMAEVDDWVSGDSARRRQADQLQIDLARVQLDRARADVYAIGGPSALGRRTVQAPSGGAVYQGGLSIGSAAAKVGKGAFQYPNPVAPGRKKDVMDLPNSPGVFEIDNAITKGPITIPGDSEPWGIDELATAVIIGAPQIAGRYLGKKLDESFPGWNGRKPYNLSDKEWAKQKSQPPVQNQAIPYGTQSVRPSPFGLPNQWY